MGANQSSGADSSTGSGAPIGRGEVKTCYYELLGINRRASEDEIKKAYRKKALELHPDRNYGNVEEATKMFANVQSAYEMLSDPQERAWYDSHRDQILRGTEDAPGEHLAHNIRITTAGDIMGMFTLFHGRMDFSDSSTGFYGVLRHTFNTLAREEELACEWEGLDPVTYPSFGHADDNYEDVVRPFYAVWNGFATKKAFSWEHVYRYADAPDRQVRRMMEKENKRFREEGIREFNEAVRSLTAFVKKRDPRFKTNVKTEAQRQKALQDAAKAQAARQRAANQAKQAQTEAVPAWMQSGKVEEDGIYDDVGEKVEEQFECVVCNKSFKSEKQYEAHEKSRKHVRAVQHIKRQMQQEDKSSRLDKIENNGTNPTTLAGDIEEDESSNKDPGPHFNGHAISRMEDLNDPNKRLSQAGETASCEEAYQKTMIGQKESTPTLNTPASSSDDEYATREKVEGRILDGPVEVDDSSDGQATKADINDISDQLASETLKGDSEAKLQPKMGKAKEKRAKKASKKGATNGTSGAGFMCAACQAGFSSKTRLFNHIKELGHAQPIPKPAKRGMGKK